MSSYTSLDDDLVAEKHEDVKLDKKGQKIMDSIGLKCGYFIGIKILRGCINTRNITKKPLVPKNTPRYKKPKSKYLLKEKEAVRTNCFNYVPEMTVSVGGEELEPNQEPLWMYGVLCQPVLYFKRFETDLPEDLQISIDIGTEGDEPAYKLELDSLNSKELEEELEKEKWVITKLWFKQPLEKHHEFPESYRISNDFGDIPLLHKALLEKYQFGLFDVEVTFYYAPNDKLIYSEDSHPWKCDSPNTTVDRLLNEAKEAKNKLISTGPQDMTNDERVHRIDKQKGTNGSTSNTNRAVYYRYPLIYCERCKQNKCQQTYGTQEKFYLCKKCNVYYCKQCLTKEQGKDNDDFTKYPKVHVHQQNHTCELRSIYDPCCMRCNIEEVLLYCIEGTSESYCKSCLEDTYEFKKLKHVQLENFVTFRNQIKEIDEEDDNMRVKPYMWLDDMTLAAMICENVISCPKSWIPKIVCDIFGAVTADIFVATLNNFLGAFWEDPISVCKFALIIAKDRDESGAPGNWEDVQEECKTIMNQACRYLPSMEYDENYAEIGHAVKKNYIHIYRNEIKAMAEHDAVFSVIIDRFWERRNVRMYPFPLWCTPKQIWVIRTFFFFLYLSLLVFHAFSNSTSLTYFKDHILDNMNYDGLDGDVTTFDDYWNWLNNSFLPGFYEGDNQFLLIADDIRIRQVRSDPAPCTSTLVPNIIEKAPTCYPRARNSFGKWVPPYSSWKNVSLSNVGKSSVLSQISSYVYSSEAYTVLLPLANYSVAQQLVNELIEKEWLDWGTEAIIIEYLVYSPNSHLMAGGVILTEISQDGYFVKNQDMIILPEQFFESSFSWTSIVLLIFFADFFVEELVDLVRAKRYATTGDKRSGSSNFVLYISSMWNVVDLVMIFSGFVFLVVPHSIVNYLGDCNLTNVWILSVPLQATHIAGSITIILAFFRSLYYLTPLEFLGILILTIFNMLMDILKFLIIFIIVTLGFSSAFHLSYSSVNTYSYFTQSFLSVFIGATSGYEMPETRANALALSVPAFAAIMQLLCVFIVIILLLNLLIGLMGQTYENMNEQATTEYRWLMFTNLLQLHDAEWPTPFCFVHVALTEIADAFLKAFKDKEVDVRFEKYTSKKERLPLSSNRKERKLFKEMIKIYFKLTLEKDEYENAIVSNEKSTLSSSKNTITNI